MDDPLIIENCYPCAGNLSAAYKAGHGGVDVGGGDGGAVEALNGCGVGESAAETPAAAIVSKAANAKAENSLKPVFITAV